MRILHTVELYHPSRGGAQEVVRQVSERLARRGHEVTVATSRLPERSTRELNGVRIEEFDVRGNAVLGMQGEVQRYQAFVPGGAFDVMLNYAAQQWATDAVFPLLGELPFPALLAPCGFSALYAPAYADYFAAMPDVLRKYEGVVVHSGSYRDAAFAREHSVERLSVIPNGASEEEFAEPDRTFRARYGVPQDVPMLLTVGSHTGMKGHALVIEAFRRARIGRAALVLIGNVLGPGDCLAHCRRRALRTWVTTLGRKRVLLLDPPREDVVAAYAAADLFVFGSNLECSPLALFETAAAGTPFVSVACGNAAEIAQWTGAGTVVPTTTRPNGWVDATPDDLAREIERLVRAPAERRAMGEHGQQAWRERFTWERIADQYERLYEAVVAARRVPA